VNVDWKNVVKNGGLKICSPAKAKALSIFPNRIGWCADNPKVAGIVVFKSQNGDDFPLSQASVNYLTKGKIEGRVEQDFILFVRRGTNGDLEFVNVMTLEEVQAAVRHLALYDPKDASRGSSYWWLPGTTTVDEEVPF
jgi:hypothetical protein